MMKEKTELKENELDLLKKLILSSDTNKKLFQVLRTTEARGEIFSPTYLQAELGLEKTHGVNTVVRHG